MENRRVVRGLPSGGSLRMAVLTAGVAVLAAACSHGGSRVNDSAAGGPPRPPTYDGNQYENPGINAFVDSATDPMSAFSADVDTGSYTVARRYVDDGNRPHPDSVRVEEYVNYFDQGYEAPETGTFTLHVDGGPSGVEAQSNAATSRPISVGAHTCVSQPSSVVTVTVRTYPGPRAERRGRMGDSPRRRAGGRPSRCTRGRSG